MKKNPLVIYHANCNDGFGAAYAAWRALRDFAEYLPMQYGDPVPDVAGRNVFIFDFSFSPKQMNEIYEASSTLVWRDHHKTAIEALPQIAFLQGQRVGERVLDVDACYDVLLDPSKSGCILAWEYFFKNEDVPRLLEFIDDRDRWQFKLKGTKELHAFLTSVPRDFQQWHCLAHSDLSTAALPEGWAILRANERTVAEMLKATTRRITLDGVDGLCANLPPCFASDVGHVLATQSGTFGLTWYVTTDAKVACSLRSNGDVDVAVIAQKFGGGGHKNAAGFTLPGDQVVWFGAGFLENQEGDLLHV